MTCREFVELVTDYFDGVLAPADHARFERHMELCPWCTRYLDQMRVTIRTVGRIDPDSLSPIARTRLLGEFRNWNARG